MDSSLIALLIIIASMVIFSVPVARRSSHRNKIYGGGIAKAFHFVAITAYVGVLPAFLCGSFLAGPKAFGLPVGFALLVIAFASLIIHAVAERPSRVNVSSEDRGWTEEDARTSGL